MRWGRSQTGAPSIVFGVGAGVGPVIGGAEAGFYGVLAELGFGVFVVFEVADGAVYASRILLY